MKPTAPPGNPSTGKLQQHLARAQPPAPCAPTATRVPPRRHADGREPPAPSTVSRRLRSSGTLQEAYAGRDNGIGVIRLGLALAVVVAHATSLGFGWEDLGLSAFRGQTNVGTLAVFAFFVPSAWLITRSARHTTPGRFAWHRALRILPGLWVCLLVTAFVVAPLVALRDRRDLAGFWAGPHGPVQYVWGNWFVGVRQYGIHDLFTATPWGRHTGNSIMDGALWSLVYEVACYAFTGLLAVTTVLQRRGWMVLLLVGGLYAVVVADQMRGRTLDGPPATRYGSVALPLLGAVYSQWVIYLGLLFGLGALAELYGNRIPGPRRTRTRLSRRADRLPARRGFFVIGFPALAYVLVWLPVRMPRRLRWIGRRNDYSYGIYIYGFLAQQVLAGPGWNRWGFWAYTAMSVAAACALGWLSWHLVERRAVRWKHWTPRRKRTGPDATGLHIDADERCRSIR